MRYLILLALFAAIVFHTKSTEILVQPNKVTKTDFQIPPSCHGICRMRFALRKFIQKNPPKKIEIKNEVLPTSLPRKPIFVNKYSPYKSDTDKQKQSAPLIMIAGRVECYV